MSTIQKRQTGIAVKRKKLEILIRQLPVDAIEEVGLFIDSLIPSKKKRQAKLSQQWAGGLKVYRKRFTSVGLQKTAMLWRME